MEDTFAPPASDYQPNPRAARILSQAIQYGYAPDPLPDLPPEWFHTLAAVLDVLASSRRVRWQTFVAAAKGFDYAMIEEVAEALEDTLDRTEQDRVLYTAKDALHEPPALIWAVEGIFAQPSLNLLVGDPGTKKTYLAIDLAVSVAMGKPWLGHPVNPSPVLFVDEETGLYQLWARLNSSLHAHGANISTPFEYISLGAYDLRDSADADQLIHRALARGSGLIVIDALANIMRAGENNLASVQPVLFNLRRMAETCKAAVVVIHHTNRHGVFRGSSSISASVDLMLAISSSPTDSLIQLSSLKARFQAPQPFYARATFETQPDGQQLFRLEPAEAHSIPPTAPPEPALPRKGLTESILEFLHQNPSSSRDQLVSHCHGYSWGSVVNALYDLVDAGRVKRVNDGGRGTVGLYALTAGEPVKLS